MNPFFVTIPQIQSIVKRFRKNFEKTENPLSIIKCNKSLTIFLTKHTILFVFHSSPFFLRSCIGVRPGVGAFFFFETQVYRDSTNQEICQAVSEKYFIYEINKLLT